MVSLCYSFLVCLFIHAVYGESQQRRQEALITGGCGFVGRHFAKKLCDMGWKITIVDNMISESALPLNKWPSHLQLTSNCEVVFHEMDCRDFFSSRDSHYSYDLFVHLAAVVGGRAKIEGSPVAVADDLAIDATAFQWAIDGHNKRMPKQMIYFSSSAAYPIKYQTDHSGIKLKENMIDLDNSQTDIAKPDLTYGWAKLTGEYLAKLSHSYYNLNVSVYRPMSGYGEDQHEAYPFKSILLKAMRKDNPIPIWSDAVRDFMHINDIVSCVLHSVEQINNANPVNLGTGKATSFADLAKLMAKEVGYEASVKILSGMPQGVMYRVGDPTRELSLGCQVSISIEEGIQQAIQFIQNNGTLPTTTTTSSSSSSPTTTSRGHKSSRQPSNHDTTTSPLTPPSPPHHLASHPRPRYSSYQCIGGSQVVPDQYWKHPREFLNKFPVYETEYRTCKIHNLCFVNNELVYYEDPAMASNKALKPFAMQTWDRLTSMGAWSPYPFKFKVISDHPIPQDIPFDHAKYHFLDAHSNSYNYGHYILDNVLPHFIAADQFGIDFQHTRQVFESSCKKFGTQPERMAHTTVPFNASLGTFRSACLSKLNGYWKYFFDFPPLYLEPLYSSNTCFDTIFVGQGSTYGLRTIDLSRAGHLRRFRDYVLDRISVSEPLPEQENLILVGIRSLGHSGGEQLDNLCELVHTAVQQLSKQQKQQQQQQSDNKNEMKEDWSKYRIRCIVNQDLDFVDEIQAVQQAKILISVHGTVSYMSLFARDGTQQIILYDPQENRFKEHNILMYLTHVQPYYHPWTDMSEGFHAILGMALQGRSTFEHQESYQSHHTTPADYHRYDAVPTMVPIDGTLVKSGLTGETVFVIKDGHRYEVSSEDLQGKYAHTSVVNLRNYEMSIIPVAPTNDGSKHGDTHHHHHHHHHHN